MKPVLLVLVAGLLATMLTPAAARAQGPAPAPARYVVEDLTPQPAAPLSVSDYDFARDQAGGSISVGGFNHAAVWDLITGRVTDLHPGGMYYDSRVGGGGGGQQVGTASANGSSLVIQHAFLWRGTSASRVSLHPAGATLSFANDTDGTVQVGSTFGQDVLNTDIRPALWRGTAASYVDLTPTHLGITGGGVMATAGGKQVGFGFRRPLSRNWRFALMWSGTAASVVELLPPEGFNASMALGLAPGQQVGEASNAGQPGTHAVLWTDDPDSAVDLHPDGFSSSSAVDTNGLFQVGTVTEGTGAAQRLRAAAWAGSADSFVNLHVLLPDDYTRSGAVGINERGDVYGFAADGAGTEHQVIWRLVPEPSGVTALVGAAAALLLRRRRHAVVVVIGGTLVLSAPPAALAQAPAYRATEIPQPATGRFDQSEVEAGLGAGTLRPPNGDGRAGVWDSATGAYADLRSTRFTDTFGTGIGGGQVSGGAG